MAQTSQNNDLQRIPKANGNTKAKRKTKSIYYCVFTKYIKVSSTHFTRPPPREEVDADKNKIGNRAHFCLQQAVWRKCATMKSKKMVQETIRHEKGTEEARQAR